MLRSFRPSAAVGRLTVCSIMLLSLSGPAGARSTVRHQVIYGEDHRHELYEEKDAHVAELARSTVALIDSRNLVRENGQNFRVRGESLRAEHDLCPTEKFANQKAGAFCSGFLVAPNTVVTAGHCIQTAQDCKSVVFAFGFQYRNVGAQPDLIHEGEIYRCRKLVVSKNRKHGDDFAVVELDRAVKNHRELEIETKSHLAVNDPLILVGHPGGIPTKIADGGTVRDVKHSRTFMANIDAYGGNSGSAILNGRSFRVEGVLLDGEEDYVETPEGCSVSNRCLKGTCDGENVLRISRVLPYLDI